MDFACATDAWPPGLLALGPMTPPEARSPSLARCDRCGGESYRDVVIHDGASRRRDCGRCGRTWGFPVWYGGQER